MLKSDRVRSWGWTAVLIVFLFLPYRWIWFPCALAVTFLIWPTIISLRQVLNQNGTLIVGSLLVLIIRTALDPGWWIPWLSIVLALTWWRSRYTLSNISAFIVLPVLWVTTFVVLARPAIAWTTHDITIKPRTVIVCAGDSLTAGLDLRSDANTYVAELRRRFNCQIFNAGVANDKTHELLKRLKKDVLRRLPTVVVLFIGGNDYLDNTPRDRFAAALDETVSQIASTGAHIVLVEVPTGIVWDPYAGIYRHIAERYKAILVPETRLRLWYSLELIARDHLDDPLTIDGIHLSASGTRRVADWLEPYIREALATSEQLSHSTKPSQ